MVYKIKVASSWDALVKRAVVAQVSFYTGERLEREADTSITFGLVAVVI